MDGKGRQGGDGRMVVWELVGGRGGGDAGRIGL